MAINRRRLLQVAAATALFGPLRARPGHATQRLLSCRSDRKGRHYACVFDGRGRVLLDQPLPGRGHAIALNPTGTLAAVFARRPGTFIVMLDLIRLRMTTQIDAISDRHFYGHGVFTADGRRLLATENAFDSDKGRIGIYDVHDGHRRLGELDSHGIGPHQLHLLNDGRTLVVANGGIRTHPDLPRVKLNLHDMQPNLSYLDSENGRLLSQHQPPIHWHQLSIRHIDVAADDLVAIAMQYEGPPDRRPPLVALHRRGGEMRLLEAPEQIQRRMRNYCGSISFTDGNQGFAVSSPRGNLVTLWDRSGRFVDHFEQPDVCGIASNTGITWYSDGTGGLRRSNGDLGTSTYPLDDNRWDNHLIAG